VDGGVGMPGVHPTEALGFAATLADPGLPPAPALAWVDVVAPAGVQFCEPVGLAMGLIPPLAPGTEVFVGDPGNAPGVVVWYGAVPAGVEPGVELGRPGVVAGIPGVEAAPLPLTAPAAPAPTDCA